MDDKMAQKQAVAELLQEALDRHNWSYQELAERAGIATTSVHNHVTGKFLPGPDTLRKYANALGLPHNYLLIVAGHAPAPVRDRPPDLQALMDALDEGWQEFTPDYKESFWETVRRFNRFHKPRKGNVSNSKNALE